MVGRNFDKNRCMVRASALAYTTLLALVPLLGVGISFATSFLKGPNGQHQIQRMIDILLEKIAPQIGLVAKAGGDVNAKAKAVEMINAALQNISSGALGVTAIIVLIFTAISLLSSIETTLNDIWGVHRGRSWAARFPLYFTSIALGGLLLVAMTLNAGPYFQATGQLLQSMPILGNLIYQFLPVAVLILTLAIFYELMPNTRVRWKAALAGGVCAGLLLYLNNTFSTLYIGQVVKNSRLYGSLGMLPLLLVGLYLSWVIVLFGAQVSYAYQNRHTAFTDHESLNLNQRGREFVALRLMTHVAQRYQEGLRPPTALELAESLSVPSRVVQQIVDPLVKGNLLLEVVGTDSAYAPARPLAKITCEDIFEILRGGQGRELSTRDEPARQVVRSEVDKIRRAEGEVAQSVTLEKLIASLTHSSTLNPAST